LEMSHMELTQRLLCSEARVDANRMRTGKLLESTWRKVTEAFGTGHSFPDWTPYVLGDEVAGRMGLRPVGVPHMGGYAVGRAIVERYLAATGLKAAQAIVRPTAEILAGAGLAPQEKP